MDFCGSRASAGDAAIRTNVRAVNRKRIVSPCELSLNSHVPGDVGERT
jgi:hypothetical protein